MQKRSWVFHLNNYIKNTNVEGKSENDSEYKINHRNVKFYRFFILYTKHHSNKIIMAHININSLRNKFDMLSDYLWTHRYTNDFWN